MKEKRIVHCPVKGKRVIGMVVGDEIKTAAGGSVPYEESLPCYNTNGEEE